MYERLKYWSTHSNRDAMHAGYMAMESFLKEVTKLNCGKSFEAAHVFVFQR